MHDRVLVVHGHHRDAEMRRRVRKARKVYRPGRDLVIFSGHNGEAGRMAAMWPDAHGILEPASRSTAENIDNTLDLVRWWFGNVPTAVAVSSWWHFRLPAMWRDRGVRVRWAPSRGRVRYMPHEVGAFVAYLYRKAVGR